jgi:hypothetical protein
MSGSDTESIEHGDVFLAVLESVGQAFADEIFRVWKRRYPEISIIPKNMHENVEFMVDRAQKVQ